MCTLNRLDAALGVAAGGLAGWAGMRLLGLEGDGPAVPALALTPYAAGLAPAVALAAAARCATGPALLAGAAAVGLGAAVLPRAVPGPPPRPGVPLRVMTANVLVGRSPAGSVVELVSGRQVDVLSLQEVTPRLMRGLRDAGLHDVLGHAIERPAPGAAGIALLARHPLTAVDEAELRPGSSSVLARIEVPGAAPTEIAAVHPPAPQPKAWRHEEWWRGVAALPQPRPDVVRVVAGDLNATLDHAVLRGVLARGFTDAAAATGRGWSPTWPARSRLPAWATIDHVLVDRRVGVAHVEVLDLRGSDHRCVVADLVLPAAGPAWQSSGPA